MHKHGRMGYIFQMIKRYLIFIITAVFMVLFIQPFYPADSFAETKKIDKYGFEKKDREVERIKLLEKLEDDKKKVELAIDNTKRLADKSRNMEYLPELYLRLAELYIEQSRIVFFIRQNQSKTKSKILDNLEANTLKNKAIETYTRILNDFPDFSQMDKVRFFLAHEYRELNKTDKMIEQYRSIIKLHPGSHYVPESFLLLGDHFMASQKFDMALKHYKKVLKYPKSSAIVIARYKLAWVHVNQGEFKEAIRLFELSVKNNEPGKELDVDTYKRVDVKLESLVDMAYCYPEVYKKNSPKKAIEYFRNYSWSRQVFIHVLEKLGYRYLIKRKYKHSIEVYRELAKLQHDVEKKIEYAKNIFESLKEIDEFEKAEKDMEFIIEAIDLQKYSIRIKDKDKEKNIKEFELYARDIATNLHKKAKTSENKSKEYFNKAALVYKQYIESFDADTPVYRDMLTNYAETLFASGDYLEAGKQYEKLIKLSLKKPETKKADKDKKENETLKGNKDKISRNEMLSSAIISYYNALKNRDNLNYYETEFARSGLRQNGEVFMKDYPTSPKVPDIAFNIAWITFDSGKYEDAIVKFSDFLNKYPKGKTAESAVHLVIEAYHIREDYEGLVNFGTNIQSKEEISPKLRADVAKIVEASEAKLVGALTIEAMNDWDKGKGKIEEFAEKHIKSALGEKAIKALVASGRDKGELETIFTAGHKLLKHYPDSKFNADVLAIMIDSAGRAGQYRVVSNYLEEFSKKLPKHKRTPFFLNQAGNFRKTLGQFDLSTTAYQRLLSYLKINKELKKGAVFSIVSNSEKTGEKDIAIAVLKGNKKLLSRSERVKADAVIAELYRKKGDYKSALKYRKYALKGFKKRMLKNNPELGKAISEMNFNAVHGSYPSYMKLRLIDNIDNKIVLKKTKMLENLENGYISIIKLGSPESVLKACYFAAKVNIEFADFLKSSPMPQGLSEEQQGQYNSIIAQKAKAYEDNAKKYLDTCVTQSHKWQVINPNLVEFYAGDDYVPGSFAKVAGSSIIAEDFLKDDELKDLHYRLYQEPDNPDLLIKLSMAYFDRNDFYQAISIAWNLLENTKDKVLMGKAYKIIGVSNLYKGNDLAARDSFKKAIELNIYDIESQVNLAGILNHYRHDDASLKIYKILPENIDLEKSGGLVHPFAKELYDGFMQSK